MHASRFDRHQRAALAWLQKCHDLAAHLHGAVDQVNGQLADVTLDRLNADPLDDL